jgi:hypothetical protein
MSLADRCGICLANHPRRVQGTRGILEQTLDWVGCPIQIKLVCESVACSAQREICGGTQSRVESRDLSPAAQDPWFA